MIIYEKNSRNLKLLQKERGRKEFRKTATVFATPLPGPAYVATEEGTMKAEKGDYLCQANTKEAEIWVIKRAIFERTYTEV